MMPRTSVIAADGSAVGLGASRNMPSYGLVLMARVGAEIFSAIVSCSLAWVVTGSTGRPPGVLQKRSEIRSQRSENPTTALALFALRFLVSSFVFGVELVHRRVDSFVHPEQ